MKSDLVLNTIGEFTWFWNDKFFVETEFGNFIWSDPDYNGNNTFTFTKMNIKRFCKNQKVPFGRSKGKHIIKVYCGENIIIKGI